EVHDEEDAAEELEELAELVEDLLEEEIVRLHDEDRARGRVAEVACHPVVAELHPRIEPRGVDEHGAGLGEIRNIELDVDLADRVRHVDGRIERLAGELRLADAAGELIVA